MNSFRLIPIKDIPNSQSYDVRYLYVIGEVERVRPVKVGRADNPVWRISSLQAGNFRELQLLRCWSGTRSAITSLELALHSRLSSHRVAREWFDVSVETVEELMERINGAH